MRQPLIAGNWKMNGSQESITALLNGVKAGMADVAKAEVAVCAPTIYIPLVQDLLKESGVTWGGEDLSVHDSGAYTGEISASMLNDFACKYVLVGHSERRSYHHEDDEVVAEKFEVAINAGLIPVLCIGETLEQREQGITEEVVVQQIEAVITRVGIDTLGKGVIAYEPVWAIGTGKTATPEMAQDAHATIRTRIAKSDATVADKIQILYGGSMNASNAAELLAQADIDGGLIGGASLKVEDFLAIALAAN
ncbi:MAG TPA: triose-phosphate isomerase [Gammaproteobacteria bacterium]|nr:triose-phosphate isomerase [Gammaproteobacteria bacterium]